MTEEERIICDEACRNFNWVALISNNQRKLTKIYMEQRDNPKVLKFLSDIWRNAGCTMYQAIEINESQDEFWNRMIQNDEFYQMFKRICCKTKRNKKFAKRR